MQNPGLPPQVDSQPHANYIQIFPLRQKPIWIANLLVFGFSLLVNVSVRYSDTCELRRVFVFWAGLGSNLTNCKKSNHCSAKPQSTRHKILERFCVDCFFAKWGNKGIGECLYSLTEESRCFSTKMQHFPFHSFRVLQLHIMGRVMLSNKIKSLKVFSAICALRRSCDYLCYVTNVM